MRRSDLIDKLQDVICKCDSNGAILDSNEQFKQKVSFYSVSKTNSSPLNFVDDLLHPDHQKSFAVAVEIMQSNSSLPSEEQSFSISLGVAKTLSTSSKNSCNIMDHLFCCFTTSHSITVFLLIFYPDMSYLRFL